VSLKLATFSDHTRRGKLFSPPAWPGNKARLVYATVGFSSSS